MAASFHADQADSGIVQEGVEQAHGVRSTANACDRGVGQTALRFLELNLGFLADHRLKVAHHHGIGVRTSNRADEIIGVSDVSDPVAHRLVHGILQGASA